MEPTYPLHRKDQDIGPTSISDLCCNHLLYRHALRGGLLGRYANQLVELRLRSQGRVRPFTRDRQCADSVVIALLERMAV